MTADISLEQAIVVAREHALAMLKARAYDPIYLHTLDQLAIVERALGAAGVLHELSSGEIDVGRMVARELGNDEAEFAHAFHIIQGAADDVTGDNAENRAIMR